MRGQWGRAALMAGVMSLPGVAMAQTEQGGDAFALGEIVVTARARNGAIR